MTKLLVYSNFIFCVCVINFLYYLYEKFVCRRVLKYLLLNSANKFWIYKNYKLQIQIFKLQKKTNYKIETENRNKTTKMKPN